MKKFTSDDKENNNMSNIQLKLNGNPMNESTD